MDKLFYKPLKPFILTQKFGENKACIDVTGTKVITCDGFNPPTGYRSVYGPKGHTGIDAVAHYGTPVYNSRKGIVDSIDTNPRTGLDVRIVSEIGGKAYRHIYEHLLGYQHKVGDLVETGQVIGWADNTGFSSANHLHFQLEVWEDNRWIPIDPELLMSNIHAQDVLWAEAKLLYLREQVALLAEAIAEYLRTKKR